MNSATAATISLEESALLAEAQAVTSLIDWGKDQSFRQGLSKLVASVNEMQPPPSFIEQARTRLLGSLTTKLRLIEDEKQHPEILAETIEHPLIIIGLPRTGTTVLYDLLALDPAARTPRDWEFATPWPAPDRATWGSDPRIAQLNAVFAHWLKQSPKLADIQAFDATHPSECNLAFTHHFASTQFPAEWGVPSYGRWLRETQIPGRYAAHRRILQQLQWKGPRGRWTLKSPEHLCTIEGLVESYPDACLIWTHRDPVSAFSSLASMISEFRAAFGMQPDHQAIGRYVVDTWACALEHATAVRMKSPNVDHRVIDIAHKDTIQDKPGVVRRVYEHFSLPFSSEHESRVRAAATGHVSERLGKHKHRPEDFGIDATEVSRRLPLYMDRFGELF